jgi:uncharacterized repeat protein (TIGR03803 family)
MALENRERRNRLAVAIGFTAAVAAVALPHGARAATLRTLHPFCARASCTDGSSPYAPLLRDSAGNFYGTAFAGGANNLGVVFELVNTGTGYRYEVLHNFCSKSGCPDGKNPVAGLIIDSSGDLYGLAKSGGTSNLGTLFELIPGSSGWTIKVRYNFAGGFDGTLPVHGLTYQGASSGAPYDGTSPLYGVTLAGGGSTENAGVAFQVTPVSGQTLWNESVLYAFCSKPSCRDGNAPSAPPIVDGNGNLFGVTRIGGFYNFGVAFEIPAGGGSEIVMHNFCHLSACADGSNPVGLTMDASGNFLGMTAAGGAHGAGAIFKIVPNATGFKEAVLYSFCAASPCLDGQAPQAGLTPDGTGTFFGTTRLGGNKQGGVIFRFRPGHYTKIADFCTPTDCPHGIDPYAPVILDPSGNLFGTANLGGANNAGTVFELRR